MNPNENPYRELFKSQAIHTLGVIGQSQKLFMYSLLRKNGLIFIQEMHSHSLIKTSIILNKFFLINCMSLAI